MARFVPPPAASRGRFLLVALTVTGVFAAGVGTAGAQAAPPPPSVPDPVANGDAPSPENPITGVTVPPPEQAGANVSEVIVGGAEEAQRRHAEAQQELAEGQAAAVDLEARLDWLSQLVADLEVEQRRLAAEVATSEARLRDRAVGVYVTGNEGIPESALVGDDLNVLESRQTLASSVLESDRLAVAQAIAARAELTAHLSRAVGEVQTTRINLASNQARILDLQRGVDAAEFELAAFEAGSDIVVSGFVFPVAEPHSFDSTFGAPRSGGRQHQGNDIFAPVGTPLYATERGVIADMGTNTLGGIKLWVIGESGTHYYYAHLHHFAEDVRDGMVVEAGDVVGYVGNTGNARTTPPHLHFEIHPNGGGAVDPYPLLSVVDQLDGHHLTGTTALDAPAL